MLKRIIRTSVYNIETELSDEELDAIDDWETIDKMIVDEVEDDWQVIG